MISVELGAALLDQEKPDWFNLVDMKKFNINRPTDCILGQIYGSYSIGIDAIGLKIGREAFNHGFINFYYDKYGRLLQSNSDILYSSMWQKEINKRKVVSNV